jgi:hypothetical protein
VFNQLGNLEGAPWPLRELLIMAEIAVSRQMFAEIPSLITNYGATGTGMTEL